MITESRLSLVGWGDYQVVLHSSESCAGLALWEAGKLKVVAEAPWLAGHINIFALNVAKLPRTTVDGAHGMLLIKRLRKDAMRIALSAMKEQNIDLLSEAVTATYVAQRMMGADLLPDRGELCKRYSSDVGVYLYKDNVCTCEIAT